MSGAFSTGLPVSFSGPYCGSTSDIEVFHKNLKKKKLDFEFQGLADGTYQGEATLLTIPPRPFSADSPANKVVRKAYGKRRVPVENFFGRMKNFKSLKYKYRHEIHTHFEVFNVVMQILKMDLEFRPLRRK